MMGVLLDPDLIDRLWCRNETKSLRFIVWSYQEPPKPNGLIVLTLGGYLYHIIS